MTIGIYKLEFEDSSFYIGRSINIEGRYKDHCSMLKRGVSTCPLVQRKYNEIHILPILHIMEEVDIKSLSNKEVDWITKTEAMLKGLNVLPGGTDILVGEKHPMSKYTNDQVVYVLEMLSSSTPIYSHLEIEKETGVKATTVKDILCGASHTWLQEKYPEMYSEMSVVKKERKKVNSIANLNPQANKKVTEYPPIISPMGDVYKIEHLSNFAQTHGLQASNLSHVLSGRRIHHKGWKLYEENHGSNNKI